jgi:hypothetical protein
MRMKGLALAAAIFLGSIGASASAPAAAASPDGRHYYSDNGRHDGWRNDDRGRHRGWNNTRRRTVCRNVWRNHHRHRVCRTIVVRRR